MRRAYTNFKQSNFCSELQMLFKRKFTWKKKIWLSFANATSVEANAYGSDTNQLSLLTHCIGLPDFLLNNSEKK